jgi:glycerophosphoryl diester phosphodiesterase
MNKLIKKIAFHRGNTWKSMENSFESLNNKNINRLINLHPTPEYIYELDVINKYPFIIHHSPNDKIKKSFTLKTNKDVIHELDLADIKYTRYKDNSKPMILKDLLEYSRENDLKLYLDIKHVGYDNDIYRMIGLINAYPDVIECVLSFNINILEILKSDLINIKYGLFIYESDEERFDMLPIDYRKEYNFQYKMTKQYIKSYLYSYYDTLIKYFKPTILSIEKDLIFNQNVYDDIIHNFQKNENNQIYCWTLSQKEMQDSYITNILAKRNIIPVFDNYDINKN